MELSLALFLSLSVELPLPTVSRENAAVRVCVCVTGLCRFVSVFDCCLVTSSDAVVVTVLLASGLFGLALQRETGIELAWR